MKLKEAFDRLRFTLTKQNKPNQTDIEAFNEIGKYFALHQKDIIQDNLLFAKLYTFLLGELTHRYSDIDFANKELNKILSEPMSFRINLLKYKIEEMEIRSYFNRKRILDPFLKTKTNEELEEIHNRYKEILPELDLNEFEKVLLNWDYEKVIYNLESNIILSITNFKNNV